MRPIYVALGWSTLRQVLLKVSSIGSRCPHLPTLPFGNKRQSDGRILTKLPSLTHVVSYPLEGTHAAHAPRSHEPG
jgi:hypothetical protein